MEHWIGGKPAHIFVCWFSNSWKLRNWHCKSSKLLLSLTFHSIPPWRTVLIYNKNSNHPSGQFLDCWWPVVLLRCMCTWLVTLSLLHILVRLWDNLSPTWGLQHFVLGRTGVSAVCRVVATLTTRPNPFLSIKQWRLLKVSCFYVACGKESKIPLPAP